MQRNSSNSSENADSTLVVNGTNEEVSLYDEGILKELSFEGSKVKFNPPVSTPTDLGNNLRLRPLRSGDYDKGFLEILAQLTKVGDVSRTKFLETFNRMLQLHGCYYVTVIEDVSKSIIVASATLFIEQKFIHSTGLRARLEDVVVSDEYRGKQLGKIIVETLRLLAKHLGCYKMSLDCKDEMTKFYSQFGFVAEPGNSNMMCIRFHE